MRRLLLLAVLLASCSRPQVESPSSLVERAGAAGEKALRTAASAVYERAKANRLTFDHGPCLADELVRGVSLDMVHEPRIPQDDLSVNRCPSDKPGRRVVELDTKGDFLRVR